MSNNNNEPPKRLDPMMFRPENTNGSWPNLPNNLSPAAPPEPRSYRTPIAANLPDDSRVLCIECFGKGTTRPEAHLCLECRTQGFCPLHRCRICQGSGVVCPRCRGMRFVRMPKQFGSDAQRCTLCCEGNQVNQDKERRAIMDFLRHNDPDSEWKWRQQLAEAEANLVAAFRTLNRQRRHERELKFRTLPKDCGGNL
jgi:hypothetical protein